jgi:NAD(P)-dependent dehydrogenase (short-subunit alcohol dehydrogenase family)
MSLETHEQTINDALGEVLRGLSRRCVVRTEKAGGVFAEGGGRPDILVETQSGWPVIIEAEVRNRRQAEKEAVSRLGRKITTNIHPIETVIALVYPEKLRKFEGAKLRDELRKAELEYAVFHTVAGSKSVHRLPDSGFLSGRVHDLVLALNKADISAPRIAALTDVVENGINAAEGSLRIAHPIGTETGKALAEALGQRDDDEGQTRKMALVVVTNALVFHETLAQAGLKVVEGRTSRPLKSPELLRDDNGQFSPTQIRDEWNRILKVNYWPIFHTAKLILERLGIKDQVLLLDALWKIAEPLIAGGVTRSHDMTGVIFQRLIADRKVLATFYTRPACASLLVGLAIPLEPGRKLPNLMRIGDFACGTGTLISTAYNRFSEIHEVMGTDSETLHAGMMKDGLVGLDVLNVAVHLTAAMLAGSHPKTIFSGECLLTMPYGVEVDGRHKALYLGSLNLLENQFDLFEKAVRTAGGTGEDRIADARAHLRHGSFDLVVMNPPFTRSGKHVDMGKGGPAFTAFSAFEISERDQKALSKELSTISKGTCADGNAGMAAYFVALAHTMVKGGGTVAFVLPLSAVSGSTWAPVRDLWKGYYTNIHVVTISSDQSESRSFSADTGMAECLVVAQCCHPGDRPEPQAIFSVISRQPRSSVEGELFAAAILRARQDAKGLSDGPVGGTPLYLGDEKIGELLRGPLTEGDQWPLVGISDMSLAQTAFALANGSLKLAGFPAHDVPMSRFRELTIGQAPYDLDIDGDKADGTPRGPFRVLSGWRRGEDYPCLWSHEAEKERTLELHPDSHGSVRKTVTDAAIDKIWNTATCLHYNRDLRFNSQSLVAAMTTVKAIGGRAWPSVLLKDLTWEYAGALWCNSSLGLLCHWWAANKTQNGRGSVTVTAIPSISTLDLAKLTKKQHATAKKKYEELKGAFLLPFNQIDADANRTMIDRAILVDVLELPDSVCADDGPIALLRKKLAAEPQIHGGKQSKVEYPLPEEEIRAVAEE